MKHMKLATLGTALLIAAVTLLPSGYAFAQSSAVNEIQKGVNSINDGEDASNTQGAAGTIKTIVNLLLFVIGAISVIMIMYGGFKYITSGGEAAALTSAKNTILYAVVGLFIAIIAYAITGFIINTFQPEPMLPPQPLPGSRPGDPY